MTKKRKTGSVVYWIFLFLYTIALLAVVVFGLKILWDFALVYEDSGSDKVIKAYTENLQKNFLDEGVLSTLAQMPHEYQTDEEVSEYVKQIFSGAIEYYESDTESSSDTKTYMLVCDNRCFGNVTLVKDSTKDATYSVYGYELPLPWDLRPWIVSKEEFDFNGLYTSIEVTIPETYTVLLNGKTLTLDYITERDIKYDVLENYYDIVPNLPTKVKYKYDNVIGNIEPVIQNENGEVVVIDSEKDDSQFIESCGSEQLTRLDAFCKDFTYEYLKYISGINKGAGYGNLAPYLQSGSDLDQRMQQNQDGLGWAHTTSFNLDSYSLQGAISLGEGYCVCSIVADTTTYTTGQGEVKNTSELNVLVYDSGSEIKAVSMV